MLNYDIEKDLCFIVQRVNRQLSRQIDEALRILDLTGEQATLLAAVDAAPPARAKDLSYILGLDASTISANIKPLINRGLVSVVVDPFDRRSRRLSLTAEGACRLGSARIIVEEFQAICPAGSPKSMSGKDLRSAECARQMSPTELCHPK